MERQRRYRRRRRDRVGVTLVEYDGRIIDLLIDARWLNEVDSGSTEKIGAAISRGLRLLTQMRLSLK
jgi:hypothetical protein